MINNKVVKLLLTDGGLIVAISYDGLSFTEVFYGDNTIIAKAIALAFTKAGFFYNNSIKLN